MTIKLDFQLPEYDMDIQMKLRESEATKFLREIILEHGQNLISSYHCNKKKEEIVFLNKEVFSLNRKVNDGIRFRIDLNEGIIDGNSHNLKEDEKAFKIVIILESPHKSEYNYSYKYYAKSPANGITGINIKESIKEKQFWDILFGKETNIIKTTEKIVFEVMKNILKAPVKNIKKFKETLNDEDEFSIFLEGLGIPVNGGAFDLNGIKEHILHEKLDFYVVNRICYQASLGSYYNKKLITPIKNNIFKAMWKRPEVKEDFYNRLFNIKPNVIINASTNELDIIQKQSFHEELIRKTNEISNEIKLFTSNHPSRGKITDSLEEVK